MGWDVWTCIAGCPRERVCCVGGELPIVQELRCGFAERRRGELGVFVGPDLFERREVHCVFVVRNLLWENACGDLVVVNHPDCVHFLVCLGQSHGRFNRGA